MEKENEFVKMRIENNYHLFTEEERKIIMSNIELISKVYLLGAVDGEE